MFRITTWLLIGTVVVGEESKKDTPTDPALAKELAARVVTDQAARMEMIAVQTKKAAPGTEANVAAEQRAAFEKMSAEDDRNRKWLKEVVAKHGWPGKTLVGVKGAHDAWLLVQHADADREFQKACLAKMEAMPKGEVAAIDIAYLTDRVLVGEGKKQKYGTQATFKDGKVAASPIEDEANVDARRKELGLEPLADYLKKVESMYKPAKK